MKVLRRGSNDSFWECDKIFGFSSVYHEYHTKTLYIYLLKRVLTIMPNRYKNKIK
jgi:hypothetical protein